MDVKVKGSSWENDIFCWHSLKRAQNGIVIAGLMLPPRFGVRGFQLGATTPYSIPLGLKIWL
jgi:hypothetical protein